MCLICVSRMHVMERKGVVEMGGECELLLSQLLVVKATAL